MKKLICATALIMVMATMFSACGIRKGPSLIEKIRSFKTTDVTEETVTKNQGTTVPDPEYLTEKPTEDTGAATVGQDITEENKKGSEDDKTKPSTKPSEQNKGEAYITDVGDSTLNLRKEASANSEKLASIPNNTELIIYKISGEWGYTKYNGKNGWVSMNYVVKKQDAGKVKPTKKGDFTFRTTDLNGNAVSYSDFANAKLVMVNFWEPWCGPCVGEMPDLEELYEKYKKDGLVILGVYYSVGYDYDAKEVVDDIGITYPILKGNSQLEKYTTEYVPTTILVDKNGNVITSDPYIGSKSYSEWESIIKDNLYK